MPEVLVAKLNDVLDLERQALLSADFDALGPLLDQKQGLLTQLERVAPRRSELKRIAGSMADNQSILAAAIKGVAAAGERLEALQNVQNSLSVYDHSGRVELIQKHQHALEKKA